LKSDLRLILPILYNANNRNLCILRLTIFYVLNIQFKLTFDHIGSKHFLCFTDNLIEIDKDTGESYARWTFMNVKMESKQVDIPRMRPATSPTLV